MRQGTINETPCSTGMALHQRRDDAKIRTDDDQENNHETVKLSDRGEGSVNAVPLQATVSVTRCTKERTKTGNPSMRKRSASVISTSSDFSPLYETPPSKVPKITANTAVHISSPCGTRSALIRGARNSNSDSPLSMLSRTPSFHTQDESEGTSSNVTERSSQAFAGVDEDVLESDQKPSRHKDRDQVYESDSSLDDLTDLLGVRHPVSSGLPDTQSVNIPDTYDNSIRGRRSVTRTSNTTASTTFVEGAAFKIHTPPYKHSLSTLIKQKERDLEAGAETEKANQALMTAEHILQAVENSDSEPGDIVTLSDTRFFGAVNPAGDDKSAGQRIMKAMKRTETLRSTKRWNFFCGKGYCDLKHTALDEPPRDEFPPGCRDGKFRDQAFATGLCLQWFQVHPPSREMFHWLWHSACSEFSQDLSMSYRAACAICHHQYASALDTTFFRKSFLALGAAAASVDVEQKVSVTSSEPSEVGVDRETGLLRRLGVIQDASPYMSPDANVYCIEILLRLGIDKMVEDTSSLYVMIQHTIFTIINVLFEQNLQQVILEMCRSIFDTIEPAQLRVGVLNLVCSDSGGLFAVRQALALAFFTGQWTQTELFGRSTESITKRILHQLDTSPLYRLTNTTDYQHLFLSVTMLDVAVDNALVPDFQSQPLNTPEEIWAAKVTFDGHIDTITKQIRRLFTHIVDGGAGNMARTEAKAAVERLLYRLDYAVRTRPPQKTSALGHEMCQSGVELPQTSLMAKFIVRKSRVAN